MKALNLTVADLPYKNVSPHPNYRTVFYLVKRQHDIIRNGIKVVRVPQTLGSDITVVSNDKKLKIKSKTVHSERDHTVPVLSYRTVCIANIKGTFNSHLDLGRIGERFPYKYLIIRNTLTPKEADPYTKEELLKYFTLFRKRGFFNGFNYRLIKKGILLADVDKHSYRQTFIAYCIIRFLEDDPHLVRTLLRLVDKGLDFYVGLAVANSFSHNTGHSFLMGRSMIFGSPKTHTIPLVDIAGVYQVISTCLFENQRPISKKIPDRYVSDILQNSVEWLGRRLSSKKIALPVLLKYGNALSRSIKVSVAKHKRANLRRMLNKIEKDLKHD